MKVVAVIPARYKSSRFPGKPLVKISGVPMIIRVAERTSLAVGKENVVIGTENEEIKRVCEAYGYKALITSDSCLTGTDRVWEIAQQLEADVYVNVQGDEPIVDPADIHHVINEVPQSPGYVINGMKSLSADEDPANINIPKVLTNSKGELIYMSRLPIPGVKNIGVTTPVFKKQVCIYAFSFDALKAFGTQEKKGNAEFYEDIEILRFLELGIPVKMVEMKSPSIAVDIPEDVSRVELWLKKNQL
ncbi:3-deoxy-manno-octulosonate cytidylyltransferase [Chitinophaga eiseniae]|uniref:3-deoxy-manno-octulosonate cytidylyltransferase n=1 Tax=Chitinophaga eiseniae TaxID=634771 RepID=A0A847SHU2_9BACT|nr:3-deoxy-manno-octulosonate cytidylyltransferase [Chitinophaga eiseniae]NLR78595.1 3-deoxy-manno-octulosonate cytidylyltransferase [Chitinophaga eiseniae]